MSQDFRAIDPGAIPSPVPAPDPGAVPMLQWLEIRLLVVDGAYQREIARRGEANIARIAAEFRWSRFSPVVVSPVAGGLYAIVDGQHRTTAAAVLGYLQVPCQVIIAGRAEQADAFRAINGAVTRVSSMAIYHAAVAGGDPAAVEVAEICARVGVKVLRSNRSIEAMAAGDCTAPAALLAAHRAYGAAVLETALSCVTRTANHVPGALISPVIAAVAAVVAGRQKLSRARLLGIFNQIELELELANFRLAATGGDRFGKLAEGFAAHLGQIIDTLAEAS